MSNPFAFPISAVFIGANLAFAGIIHYSDLIKKVQIKIKTFLVILTITAGGFAVLASQWFLKNYWVGMISIVLLFLVYIGIAAFSVYEVILGDKDKREEGETEELISQHLPRNGETGAES